MKHLQVIIVRQTVSEGYYVMMKGHEKNPEFKSVVTNRISDYKEAYQIAHAIGTALALAKNTVQVLNDKYAQPFGDAYCEHMAFKKLEVYSENRNF